jgi:hypothetical protein
MIMVPADLAASAVAEDARFELARDCPNTLSKSVDHSSGIAVGVRDLGRSDIAYACARLRTLTNETETETGPVRDNCFP